MEHDHGNRGNNGEAEDDATLIDAFFLPGGILDPENDSDTGYRDAFSYEDTHSFIIPSFPSPVSLNPWETSQAEPDDAAMDWLGTHSPSSRSLLPEILPSALSPSRQQASINPANHVLLPASVTVPPPGFHRFSSEKTESRNTEPSSTEDSAYAKRTLNLTSQIQLSGSISFADIIRSYPSSTLASPERKLNETQPRHYPRKENDEKFYSIKIQKPRARSSSPKMFIRNGTARSVPNFHKARTKETSKQVGKDTVHSTEWNDADRNASPIFSTEWNAVDRNSLCRATSKLDNIGTTAAVQMRPRFEYPVLRYDSDDDNHSKADSPSEPSIDLSQDCIVNASQILPTERPIGVSVAGDAKADFSHTVSDTEDADAQRAKTFKATESKANIQCATAKSLPESSDVNKTYFFSTESETFNSEVFAVLAPLLEQLIMSTNYVARLLWIMTQLIAIGARNIFIYATFEASLSDGTLSCYLVLYTLPMLCDWFMIRASLPHFLPHVISTFSLCFLSQVPGHPPRTTASGVSDDACRLILHAFQCYLSLTTLLEGFKGPNCMIMSLDSSTRLVLAYVLSMLRAGFLLSPLGWFGWSIQVILSSWLPEGLLSSCILSLSGLALLRLTSELPDHKASSN